MHICIHILRFFRFFFLITEKRTLRSKDRNRQCVPSDDEDDDEDELESSDEEDNVGGRPLGKSNPITASTTVKPKLRQPLPSDDEEDEEEGMGEKIVKDP